MPEVILWILPQSLQRIDPANNIQTVALKAVWVERNSIHAPWDVWDKRRSKRENKFQLEGDFRLSQITTIKFLHANNEPSHELEHLACLFFLHRCHSTAVCQLVCEKKQDIRYDFCLCARKKHHNVHMCKIVIHTPEHRGHISLCHLFNQNTVTQQTVIQKKAIPHPMIHCHHSLPLTPVNLPLQILIDCRLPHTEIQLLDLLKKLLFISSRRLS